MFPIYSQLISQVKKDSRLSADQREMLFEAESKLTTDRWN